MVEIIRAKNVCVAFEIGYHLLLRRGLLQPSRNGEVYTVPEPVITTTENPRMRVLFSRGRNANPFFHFMEALWMLAGRNDGGFLDTYIKNYSQDFGEPGSGIIHGAYGHRWRAHFQIDQIQEVIDKLLYNPNDRQCVIEMWDAEVDLAGDWKDRPCNTHIYLRVLAAELHMTVCCRSNDAIWGAHGSNAVHFSILQEYIAAHLGVGVGLLHQFSNNYHAYVRVFDKYKGQADLGRDLYTTKRVPILPLIEDLDSFDSEVDTVLCADWQSTNMKFKNPSIQVAWMMKQAFNYYREGDVQGAYRTIIMAKIPVCDWRLACMEWMARKAGVYEPAL